MSVVDDLLKKMKMVSDDDYDDENDDFDEEADEEILSEKSVKNKRAKAKDYDDYDMDDDEVPAPAVKPVKPAAKPVITESKGTKVVGMNRGGYNEVCMIMPKSYEDAHTVADLLLSHKAVVLNMERMGMAAAQRIIDFTTGSCYTIGGNLQQISNKIFIVVPQDMNLSGDFGNIVGSMVDLENGPEDQGFDD